MTRSCNLLLHAVYCYFVLLLTAFFLLTIQFSKESLSCDCMEPFVFITLLSDISVALVFLYNETCNTHYRDNIEAGLRSSC